MINLILVLASLIFLPILLGYIHCGINKRVPAVVILYRYFVFFNVVVAGIFVAARMNFQGVMAAQIAGWPYSPIFHSYSIAILSIAVMSLCVIFNRTTLMLAPAICWVLFLVISTVWHIYQIRHHQLSDVNIMYLHATYDLICAGILALFIQPVYSALEKRMVFQ